MPEGEANKVHDEVWKKKKRGGEVEMRGEEPFLT